MKSFITLALSIFFSVGCATSMLNVQSKPGVADVYIVPQGQQPINLGKTPLNINSQQIAPYVGGSAYLLIQKEGYKPEAFLIPKTMFSSNIDISAKLLEDKLPLACTENNNLVDTIARDVAEAQNLTQQKEYETAEVLLLNLLGKAPKSPVIQNLLGNVYYLQKNLSRALNYYKSSLNADPTNKETARMVNKLNLILQRLPSGGSQ